MTRSDYCLGLVRDRDLDRYIATLYAPAAGRPALFALHALDLELVAVVANATEPMLANIRLAWWREQLAALDSGVVPAQPVLAALAGEVLPRGISGKSLEALEDGILALLTGDRDAATLVHYAEGRGATLFSAAARVLGGGDAAVAGRGWALGDAVRRHLVAPPEAAVALAGVNARASRSAPRSLEGLARLARADVAAALAAKPLAPRGSAGRQARLSWTMLTGR